MYPTAGSAAPGVCAPRTAPSPRPPAARARVALLPLIQTTRLPRGLNWLSRARAGDARPAPDRWSAAGSHDVPRWHATAPRSNVRSTSPLHCPRPRLPRRAPTLSLQILRERASSTRMTWPRADGSPRSIGPTGLVRTLLCSGADALETSRHPMRARRSRAHESDQETRS